MNHTPLSRPLNTVIAVWKSRARYSMNLGAVIESECVHCMDKNVLRTTLLGNEMSQVSDLVKGGDIGKSARWKGMKVVI